MKKLQATILIKILLLMIPLLFCSNIQAKKLFVEMEFYKNSIRLDDGTNKKLQIVKGKDGKELKFISLIGALNYMSLQGWELVNTKSIMEGAVGVVDTRIYYIFARDVPDDELEQIVNNSYKE